MLMKPRALAKTLLALTLAAGFACPAWAQATNVDFGDDTSEWSKDGECDDPRFTGAGMASELEDADILKDATDCRTAFEAGTITLVEAPVAETVAPATTAAPEIDFGDDTSNWANDGECDDPRFTGSKMAVELEDVDIRKDATDCRTAFEAGRSPSRMAPQQRPPIPPPSILAMTVPNGPRTKNATTRVLPGRPWPAR
ncbi:hypothetical protein [Devosia aurantiaca]|uniref:Uncharacterized protein n=1 Tax=Devosia aurantiaca TaxID=2714858 RepID=A0A6M1SJ80_9HYPH|nr:hypothetical protein [Devosia aurantiaca]NGP16576.1 hypothetical protein [Devosia aurantiaca]